MRSGRRVPRLDDRSRLVLALLTVVAAVLSVVPASAAPALVATPYALVDLGDRVAWRGPCGDVRVRASWSGGTLLGPAASGRCGGSSRVPSFAALTARGWRQGVPLDLRLEGAGSRVPLRYQRIEVDARPAAAGRPTVQTASPTDPDTGPHDRVLAMTTGDAVDLGRVDVRGVNAIALRLCVVGAPAVVDPFGFGGHDVPVRMSVHQDSPDGPELVRDTDVANDVLTYTDMGVAGFGGTCWRLANRVVTGSAVQDAPRLFLVADLAVPGVLQVSSIDLNGGGGLSTAGPNWVTPDPPGMRTVFDGRSFAGWTQTGCVLRDRAATSARTGDRTTRQACSMTLDRPGTNRVLRLELRKEWFEDNAGIYLPQELQVRQIGEYGALGYFGEYAARWQKLHSWPHWSTVEVVQVGARYVARVNGRTVTDHVASRGAPAPYSPRLATQPQFSQRYEVRTDGQNEPDVATPDEHGGVWFRDVRVYECRSSTDPVCLRLLTANEGQAPRA